MAGRIQEQLSTLLAAGALLAGCAHGTTAGPVGTDGAPALATTSAPRGDAAASAQGAAKEPICVVVTGSRLPRCVQAGAQVLPSDAQLRVYGQDELLSTGHDGNLAEALRALDPSIRTHP